MSPSPGLSIGALARATGIAVETLRTWERRYGFPHATRLPSGHRRYPLATVGRIRRMRDLIGRGHPASTVLPLDDDALDRLVAATRPARGEADPAAGIARGDVGRGDAVADGGAAGPQSAPDSVSAWLRLLGDGEIAAVEACLERAWGRMEPLAFLELRVGPLLREVGRRWRAGELSIAEEHLLTAALEHFLAARWREHQRAVDGPRAVLATLAGEEHALGIHQAALVSSLAGWRVAFVGTGLPVDEVALATRTLSARAVILSCSEATGDRAAESAVGRLRELLPDEVALAVGGRGAPSVPGATRFEDFEAFLAWSRRLGSMIPARTVGRSRR